jgi:hypothetical protein
LDMYSSVVSLPGVAGLRQVKIAGLLERSAVLEQSLPAM